MCPKVSMDICPVCPWTYVRLSEYVRPGLSPQPPMLRGTASHGPARLIMLTRMAAMEMKADRWKAAEEGAKAKREQMPGTLGT